jgi:ABC-2 type transport system permease protein
VSATTINTTAEKPQAPSRSFARAFEDIRDGFKNRELWAHLGWQDIKQRYRRSVLGPFWITISMAVTAIGLGLLYALLFNMKISTFLPYVTVGFIVWNFINGCIIEGMDTFVANEGLIKHLPAPMSVYALRTVWRQTLFLMHNMIVYVVMLAIFFRFIDHTYTLNTTPNVTGPIDCTQVICHPGLGWSWFLIIPAFILLALNGGWLTLFLGIISTRFRDVPQVINSLISLLFYMTPIIWSADTFFATHKSGLAKSLFQLNPLYHFVQIFRAPLLGQTINPTSWIIVGIITVVGWVLALVTMRNYRARISYWV